MREMGRIFGAVLCLSLALAHAVDLASAAGRGHLSSSSEAAARDPLLDALLGDDDEDVVKPPAAAPTPTAKAPASYGAKTSGEKNAASVMTVPRVVVVGPENMPARVQFGPDDSAGTFTVGVEPDGTFAISKAGKPIISTDSVGNLFARTHVFAAASLHSGDNVVVADVRQWALAVSQDFEESAHEWGQVCAQVCDQVPSRVKCIKPVDIKRSTCGASRLLGGYEVFSHGRVASKFKLPLKHTQVRIVASLSFVDKWEGETAFLQVSSQGMMVVKPDPRAPASTPPRLCAPTLEFVWTEQYDSRDAEVAPNVCGSGAVGEGRLAVPIDVTLPHSGEDIMLAFGSTLEEVPITPGTTDKGNAAFWGIASLQIYTR